MLLRSSGTTGKHAPRRTGSSEYVAVVEPSHSLRGYRYLYRPFADFEAGWVAMTPKTEATRWRKATIEVDDMPHMLGAGTFHPSIFATLFNGYDYGTADVFGLFDALATVWRLGNRKIQAALRGPNGICVIPKASQSPDVPYDPKDVAIKTALARLEAAVYRPQELRPDNITVRAIEEIPIQSIMLCLLDVMFWLKAAGAPGHVDVCVFDSRLETAEAYVKIVSGASCLALALLAAYGYPLLSFKERSNKIPNWQRQASS